MMHSFTGPFVWWKKLPIHDILKKDLLPLIKHDLEQNKEKYVMPDWDCQVYSTIRHQVPFLLGEPLLQELVWKNLDECLTETKLSLTPMQSSLSNIWYNVYQPGYSQEVHNHSTHSFSGIYLLELDEPNPTSFFYAGDSPFQTERYDTPHMEEGTVILFPASLPHYVKPATKDRVTIAFNINTTFV